MSIRVDFFNNAAQAFRHVGTSFIPNCVVKQVQDFSDVRDIADRLWDLRADGMTPMYDALVKATEDLLKRPERRRVILLVSDGGDSTSRATLDEVIRKATDVGITIYCVDMSDRGVYRVAPRDNGHRVARRKLRRKLRRPGCAKPDFNAILSSPMLSA